MRSTAYVIGPFGAGTRGSASLPYGAQHLAGLGFDVNYGDPTAGRGRRTFRLTAALARRLTGGPVLDPLAEPGLLRSADLLICMLEDNLTLLAPVVRLMRRSTTRRSVLVVVWLGADLEALDGRARRRWRRRLCAFDRVLVFSANQVPLFEQALDLPAGLVGAIPFGVESLTPTPPAPGSRHIVSAGSDRGRDFPTFVAAVTGLPATIVTNAAHRAELGDVASVEVTGPLPRAEYLARLLDARIVVSPTRELAYPTGQTVLLEAMQLGRPCVVTRSEALDGYVTDGVDVLTVPAHDPVALRAAIDRLDSDDALRERIASNAAARAARFTEPAMWAAIVDAAGVTR